MPLADYLRTPVSNGNPVEQALIRQWWHEEHGAKGRLVWEYYLGDCYLDAMWFPDADVEREEHAGTGAPRRFPFGGRRRSAVRGQAPVDARTYRASFGL